jgi:hypothetical protein
MKIFISHASANKGYGDALVELLRGIGIGEDEIIYTSNTAYGIPTTQNIFKWLKAQIIDKPFVIYLLSREYYSSIACLNEMGAAWIIESEHAIIFTPGFEISSKEFQNGAIDPREVGFFLDNQERLLTFIELLQAHFTISKNRVIIHQKLTKYLDDVKKIVTHPITLNVKPNNSILLALGNKEGEITSLAEEKSVNAMYTSIVKKNPVGLYEKFLNDILSGKLKNEELILLHYILETGRVKFGTGWQEQHEIARLKVWEEVTELNSQLTSNYSNVISKFEIRGYVEVSAVTSSDNPKEVKLRLDISERILEMPDTVLVVIDEAIKNNKLIGEEDDLPF